MAGPMEGTKVVELGLWVAGPAAAAMLGDWGADVIKIEPPNGDPFRGLFGSALGAIVDVNPPFELDNRGKRSIVLQLETDEAREIAYKLIADADVFITNMRPKALGQHGLDYETLHKRFPRLVYGQVTGYGPKGEWRDTAAYDVGAFWSQAGVAQALTPQGAEIPQQRGGMGDHMTGQGLAGAISAALYARERTGEGQHVSVPLVRVGMYMMGWDVMLSLRMGVPIVAYDRKHAVNPIITSYESSDEKPFWLLLLQADRHWGDLCKAIDRDHLPGLQRIRGHRADRRHGRRRLLPARPLRAPRTRRSESCWSITRRLDGAGWPPN